MNEKYYIAYGSNLSVEQMKFRTPDAVIVGTGILQDWRLLFRRFATIRKSAGFNTPVLVWKISKQDEKNLDMYEGFPRFYVKKNMKIAVTSPDGKNLGNLTAMVYVMTSRAANKCNTNSLPDKYYFSIIEAGYQRFNFDRSILCEAIREAKNAYK